jgi:hypothetical protein
MRRPLRDINEQIEFGVLERSISGGRGTPHDLAGL